MNIIKNDNIYIIKGKDRGKKGKVKSILTKENKVIISGLNKYKKHIKPTKQNPQGGIIDIELPVSLSNVMLICPSCSKTTKTASKILKDKKVRICKKCKQSI